LNLHQIIDPELLKLIPQESLLRLKNRLPDKPGKIILKVPIEEYIATRLEVEERKKWEALGYAYELKDKKLGLR
jgi:hypothetical protein